MIASAVPRRSNKCASVHATDFGWTRAFSLASRSEAHETLLFLLRQDGVPPSCICDSDNKMIPGKFYQKLKDAACQLRQLEPYISWSTAAEREIKEVVKKRSSHRLLWSRAPKHLWEDCLELEAYIRSNTAPQYVQT